ncbi:MAG: fumarylacetoacetate hydrolase family protein [Ilyomonas sp.]
MKLYKTAKGNLLENGENYFIFYDDWNDVINRDDLYGYLNNINNEPIEKATFDELIQKHIQAPIGKQEVWAAGVTYLRSRDARMEESQSSGGADCYEKVYEAERPELFFKALPHRVAAHTEEVFIRKDSYWNVPEPELTLFINSKGNIQGYTIGNDMSSRDIEGENPLYLPQAKVYERSAALGPCIYVTHQPILSETNISISIERNKEALFKDSIQLNRMKRSLPELAGWLFKECAFEYGCFLMTGTGMVPPNSFTLNVGDIVSISVEGIGTLINTVAQKKA